jgi:hypothetical protein
MENLIVWEFDAYVDMLISSLQKDTTEANTLS